MKTHRLLRQYFWLAVLPYTFATYLANEQFVNQAERLWGIHANRLNNKYSCWDVEFFLILRIHNILFSCFQWVKYIPGGLSGFTNTICLRNGRMKSTSLLLLNTQRSNNGRKCSWPSLKKKVDSKERLEKEHLDRELLQKGRLRLNNDESESE